MSLASALPSYKSDITSVFSNTQSTYVSSAQEIADATKSWATQGIPMTSDTGNEAPGQAVVGFVTSTPGTVTAQGVGGVDSSSPGVGLSAAKSALKSSLTSVFSNTNNQSIQQAGAFCDAINDFFSKAKIMTNINATVPPGQAVPGPVGPVGPGSYTGSGTGGVESSSAGAGLSVGITSFVSTLASIFANTQNTPDGAAEQIADAAESFFKTATISTTNTGTAQGGAASVDTNTGSGSTTGPSPATGSSSSGSIS
jgi:hypothetical protein